MTIIKSLFITSIVSALFGYSLASVFGFWQAFCLAFAAQIVISFTYSSWKLSREEVVINMYQEEIDNLLDLSRVIIECPCGKNRFEDVLFVGQDNVFECDVCGNTFKADINVVPTLLTEPVNPGTTFEQLVEKQKEL